MTGIRPVAHVWCLKVYRDDSTTPVVYNDVKHVFWTADNTVLVIAQYTDGPGQEAHHYIHWPRERVCWYRLERQPAPSPARDARDGTVAEIVRRLRYSDGIAPDAAVREIADWIESQYAVGVASGQVWKWPQAKP